MTSLPSSMKASTYLLGVVAMLASAAARPIGAQPHASSTPDSVVRESHLFGNFGRAASGIVSVGPDAEGRVFLMDYQRGVRQWLRATGDTLRGADGVRYSLRGGDTLVARDDRGTMAWSAARVAMLTEPLTVDNGAVRLEGTLWRPAGPGPFPAVVLVQGAGEETRLAMRQFPYFLLSRGYAVVSYDKRGSGASTGDWHPWEAGIDALAGDALAIVGALRARADIIPSKVGLLGISNGAWVIERAAARSPSVSFLVPISGGGVRIADSERYRLDRAASAAGLPAADHAALGRFLTDVYSPALLAADTSVAGRALVARIRAARGTRWFALTPLTPFADAPASVILDVGGRAWRRELSYAPDSDLARVHVPVLAISGSADQDVPARRNLAGIRRALHRVGNGRPTTLLLPGASHALLLPRHGAASDAFAPAFFPTLGRWLDAYRGGAEHAPVLLPAPPLTVQGQSGEGAPHGRGAALRDIIGTWQSDTVNGTSARSACAASPDGDSVICDQVITSPGAVLHAMSFFVPDTAGAFVFYNLPAPGATMRPVRLAVAGHVWTYGGTERSGDGRYYRTLNIFGAGSSYTWRQESSADGVTWLPGVEGRSRRVP